ncbi:hypothetical protein D3C75_1325790 [compost metagenome]
MRVFVLLESMRWKSSTMSWSNGCVIRWPITIEVNGSSLKYVTGQFRAESVKRGGDHMFGIDQLQQRDAFS